MTTVTGALMRDYRGIELPETFGDAEREYAAVRTAAGLFDLSFRAGLDFTGGDRTTFLHNMLSNDIAALRPGAGCYATLLTRESKVVADADVLCMEASIRLVLDARVKDRARAHLERFLVADDVEIEDRSELETTLGVHGPRAEEVLAAGMSGLALPDADLAHVEATVAGARVRVVRSAWTGESGFDILVPRSHAVSVWKGLLDAGGPRGLRPAGMTAANVLRIEAGVPWIGIDFDESNLVLEAGLERGIHFRKGCYLGQEIVERASARGHVNKRLVGLHLEGEHAPVRGNRIVRAGAETGQITSAAYSPYLRAPIALGYVKRDAIAVGTRVEVEMAGGSVVAEVVELPFYRRS
jgi:glycine cleavage system T protein